MSETEEEKLARHDRLFDAQYQTKQYEQSSLWSQLVQTRKALWKARGLAAPKPAKPAKWLHPEPATPMLRRVTGERKARAFFMARSRAVLEGQLTGPMLDAETEIAKSWHWLAGHMGYGSLSKTPGKGLADDSILPDYVRGFVTWQKECPDKLRGIVLDYLAFGFTLRQIAEQRGLGRDTVSDRYKFGLNEYCKLRGFGDQIKNT